MDFFDIFQITYLSIFYIIFIGRTIQLIIKGTNPIVLGMGKRGFRALLERSLLIGLALWTFETVSICLDLKLHLFSHSFLFSITPLRIFGVALELFGMAIFVSAIISFGRSWRVGIDTDQPGGLVTGGVFSISRNPIFLFLDLFFAGTFLIYPTLFFAVSVGFVIITNHLQVIREERFLEEKYGDGYRDYKKRVRRYL